MATVGDDADLRAPTAVLRRRWQPALAVLVTAVATGVVVSLVGGERFRVRAEVRLREQTAEARLGDPDAAGELAGALEEDVALAESDAVVDAVRAAYDGSLDVEDVEVEVASATAGLLEVSVVADDAEDGVALVDRYVATFLPARRTRLTEGLVAAEAEAQAEVADLAGRVAEARAPLDELEQQLADAPDDAELRAERDALAASLAPTLTPWETRLASARARLADLGVALQEQVDGGAEVVRPASAGAPIDPAGIEDVGISALIGLALAVAAAYAVDVLDGRIRSPADLRRAAGDVPTLAVIPRHPTPPAGELAVRADPGGPVARAYRALVDELDRATDRLPHEVLQVTSAAPGEGKTTVVANLAVALVQAGRSVAVVGCDLRRPSLHRQLGIDLEPGLSDVLQGDVALEGALKRTADGVLALTAGSTSAHPSELLSGEAAVTVVRALAERVDVVLMDCTPALPVTDAFVVSRMADATLVVVDPSTSDLRLVRRALEQLEEVHAPVIGVVLNGLGVGTALSPATTVDRAPDPTPTRT